MNRQNVQRSRLYPLCFLSVAQNIECNDGGGVFRPTTTNAATWLRVVKARKIIGGYSNACGT